MPAIRGKYLKAFLVENNVHFSKTHAMVRELLPLCIDIDAEFKLLSPLLTILDPFAVEFRDPGDDVLLSEVMPAISAVKKVRRFIRGKLGLEKQRRLL